MVREHHRLNGHEFEPSLGNSEGQGSLQSMASQTVRHNLVTEQQQYKSTAILSNERVKN